MARKVAVKGGPLDGKTVVVHDTQTTFTHHADKGGEYTVSEKTATWKAHKPAAEAVQTKVSAPKPARAPKPNTPIEQPTETDAD